MRHNIEKITTFVRDFRSLAANGRHLESYKRTSRFSLARIARMVLPLTSLVVIIFSAGCTSPANGSEDVSSLPEPLRPVQVSTLSSTTAASATFQSHNRRVVENARGIFTTYLVAANFSFAAGAPRTPEDKLQATFQVVQLSDDGQVMSEVFRATHFTSAPPVLLTDKNGDLYVITPDFQVVNGKNDRNYFYRLRWSDESGGYQLLPEKTFMSLLEQTSKFAAVVDDERGRIFYARKGTLYELDLSGQITFQSELITKGEMAEPQYPHLILDSGRLYFGWTSISNTNRNAAGIATYYDIHFMYSEDHGRTWSNFNQAIHTPLPADSEIAPLVVFGDDLLPDNSHWLASMHPHGQSLHFMYQSISPQGFVQRYVRYQVRGQNPGRVTKDLYGIDDDSVRINVSSGFFVSDGTDLYMVGLTADSCVGILKSTDDGETWRGFAKSEKVGPTKEVYALSGMPHLTSDGKIVGVFTQRPTDYDPAKGISVCSIQAQVR